MTFPSYSLVHFYSITSSFLLRLILYIVTPYSNVSMNVSIKAKFVPRSQRSFLSWTIMTLQNLSVSLLACCGGVACMEHLTQEGDLCFSLCSPSDEFCNISLISKILFLFIIFIKKNCVMIFSKDFIKSGSSFIQIFKFNKIFYT